MPVLFQRPVGAVQAAFWLLPTFVVVTATQHVDARWAGACLLAGIAWQLVFRRDLADRLTALCSLVAVGTVLGAGINVVLGGNAFSDADPGALAAVLACLAGLVLTEQVLRGRELRRSRRTPSPEETVPARP